MSKQDTQYNIGKILDGHKPRDAIHIAVYAARARRTMNSGIEVFLEDNGIWADVCDKGYGREQNSVGIVDPFIREKNEGWYEGVVKAGQWFYIWLTPNTISDLKHSWEHPSFPSQDPVYMKTTRTSEMIAAELTSGSVSFMEKQADSLGLEVQELLDHAERYVETGEYVNEGPRFEGVSVPQEFWDHYEHLTGKEGPTGVDRDSFFSCSC